VLGEIRTLGLERVQEVAYEKLAEPTEALFELLVATTDTEYVPALSA